MHVLSNDMNLTEGVNRYYTLIPTQSPQESCLSVQLDKKINLKKKKKKKNCLLELLFNIWYALTFI